jgi:hypothetical protein
MRNTSVRAVDSALIISEAAPLLQSILRLQTWYLERTAHLAIWITWGIIPPNRIYLHLLTPHRALIECRSIIPTLVRTLSISPLIRMCSQPLKFIPVQGLRLPSKLPIKRTINTRWILAMVHLCCLLTRAITKWRSTATVLQRLLQSKYEARRTMRPIIVVLETSISIRSARCHFPKLPS